MIRYSDAPWSQYAAAATNDETAKRDHLAGREILVQKMKEGVVQPEDLPQEPAQKVVVVKEVLQSLKPAGKVSLFTRDAYKG
eukprot:2570963-Alexandrium_andersonii.AAC.1